MESKISVGKSLKNNLATITLKPGRDKSIRHFHPWIFSGAISKETGPCCPDKPVVVCDSSGKQLALGLYNPHSQIRVRNILSSYQRVDEFSQGESLMETLIRLNVRTALERRFSQFSEEQTDAYRLIFSEGDDLPGVILDRYRNLLILQLETESADSRRDFLVGTIWEESKKLCPEIDSLWERSTGDGRKPEGLAPFEKVHFGKVEGHLFRENGLEFAYPSLNQKSGYYLDQRENRKLIANFARGRKVLDCCSYTGAFSRYCLEGGALSTHLVDVSSSVLEAAENQLKSAGFNSFKSSCSPAGDFLRESKEKWDLIVLDPPKLVPSKKHFTKGLRAYKDLNLQAIKSLSPGGILASFSCSGLVSSQELIRQIGWAASDAGRALQVIGELHQASCHPWATNFPEGRYLKGYLLRG